MSWPLSQDYNEAIQNPASSLGEPALKRGEPVVNELGLPIPRSGNFADVYQFLDANGKTWALKCFTRQVKGLRERYVAIDEHLREAHLPVTVGFRFHAEGIRIRGQWYPMLQMEWVEGFTLNEFIRRNTDKPAYLEALFLMWVRLCKRLRQADVAHGDLQHGNVLLVPGARPSTLGLKLIDYDGMWVPELAKKPSGEAGHPAFQHPARRTGIYSFEVDRFPHLLIACALRALIVGGPGLWKRFDNGDNLLFREDDLRNPGGSELVRALWEMNDPIVSPLLANLVLAAKQPLPDTPWLDHLMASEEVLALTPAQKRAAVQVLGFTAETEPGAVPASAPAGEQWTPARPAEVFAALSAAEGDTLYPSPVRSALSLYWLIPVGALAFGLLLLVLPLVLLLSDRRKPATTQPAAPTESQSPMPPTSQPRPPTPAPMEPEIEPLTVAPRDLPSPQLDVLSPVWSVPGKAAPGCFDFSGDGTLLIASPGQSESYFVYAVNDGKANEPVRGSVGPIRALCAAGMRQAILSGADNVAALWDLNQGQRVRNIQAPEGDVTPFAAAPDGMDALCPGQRGWEVIRFGLDTGMTNRTWSLESEPKVVSVRYAPDGKRWIAVDEGSQIVIFDLKSDKQTTLHDPSKTARHALLSTAGGKMLTFGKGAELRVWETSDKRVLHVLPGHPGGVTDAVLTPDERWVFSVGADRMLRVWSVESGKEVQSHELPEAASCVRLSPNGRSVATASVGGDKAAIQLWRIGR